MQIKRAIQYLLLLALAILLLYVSFKGVKWNDFISGIKSCNFYWIVLSMVIGIIGFVIRALRWRLLLKPLDKSISFKQTYNGVAVAYLTNFALPRAGELARCAVVTKKGGITFEQALGTVLIERVIDVLCLGFWVIFTMLLKWGEFGEFITKELLSPIGDRINSIPLAIVIVSILLLLLLIVAACKFSSKIASVFKRISEGLTSIIKMREKWLFLLYTLLIWGTYWCTSYATIAAFPAITNLDGADALFLMIIGGLGWAVPVQGGIGAYHFIVSLALLKVYQIPQTTGVVFATISHESQALAMIICGSAAVIGIWYLKRKRSKKENED